MCSMHIYIATTGRALIGAAARSGLGESVAILSRLPRLRLLHAQQRWSTARAGGRRVARRDV